MTKVATCVADDITYEGPPTQTTGARAAYLEAVGGFAQLMTGFRLVAALGDEPQAMLMYDMTTGPFGTLRAAEHLLIRDGKITTSKLVFDTHEVRAAQQAQAAS